MEELKQLIASLGLEMSVLSAPFNPNMPEDMFHWVCCITRPNGGLLNTAFSTGGGLLKVRDKLLRPTFSDVQYNDLLKAKKQLGSVYYDFKLGKFVNYYGRTSQWDAGVYSLVFEAKPPTIEDVLSSLALESSVLDYATFEEWATDFGYDTDSIKAEKTYRACLENTLRFRNFLGEENLKKLQGMEL